MAVAEVALEHSLALLFALCIADTGELDIHRGIELREGCVELRLRYLFDNREVVGTAEFELKIRRRLKKQADERRAAARREERRRKLFELYDGAVKNGRQVPAMGWENTRTRLELALDEMLDEEEEDREHARREAYPDAADKAARGPVRADDGVSALFWRSAGARDTFGHLPVSHSSPVTP